jgi:FixJ family two-component response regulator
VLEVRVPGLTGIQLEEALAATGRRMSSVVVTGHADVPAGGDVAVLGIGEKTVNVHRARVMEKMQTGSVAELVRLADEAGVTAPARRSSPRARSSEGGDLRRSS